MCRSFNYVHLWQCKSNVFSREENYTAEDDEVVLLVLRAMKFTFPHSCVFSGVPTRANQHRVGRFTGQQHQSCASSCEISGCSSGRTPWHRSCSGMASPLCAYVGGLSSWSGSRCGNDKKSTGTGPPGSCRDAGAADGPLRSLPATRQQETSQH